MKKNLKFLLLAPFLMAILCEDEINSCGFEDPINSIVNFENIAETYAVTETIWIRSETSSELNNSCNENDLEIVYNAEVFRGGFFILKLTNQLENLNAIVVEDYNVIYDVGVENNYNSCFGFVAFLPELSENELIYNYRIGVSVNQPGVYCIVNAFDGYFNTEQENNSELFEPYNTIDNKIKFSSCNDIYTRNTTKWHYFFKVE